MPPCCSTTGVCHAQPANLDRAAREVPADHVLTPYIEYWRLMLTNGADDARIAIFLRAIPAAAWPNRCAPTG